MPKRGYGHHLLFAGRKGRLGADRFKNGMTLKGGLPPRRVSVMAFGAASPYQKLPIPPMPAPGRAPSLPPLFCGRRAAVRGRVCYEGVDRRHVWLLGTRP